MIFTKVIFSLSFVPPLNTALGCSVNCACVVCSYACVCLVTIMLQLFGPNAPVTLLESTEPSGEIGPQQPLSCIFLFMQKCVFDLSRFIINTLKIGDRVERKVVGFTAEES